MMSACFVLQENNGFDKKAATISQWWRTGLPVTAYLVVTDDYVKVG
jgi:hypothetical protein